MANQRSGRKANVNMDQESAGRSSAAAVQEPPFTAGRPGNGATQRTIRRGRRIMGREQGQALETIGHAVDYLNDCLLFEGPDSEIVTDPSSSTEAVQILIGLHMQILHSLPIAEPMYRRLWNVMFRRASRLDSHVIPLSLR
jgi:hypothetical protein